MKIRLAAHVKDLTKQCASDDAQAVSSRFKPFQAISSAHWASVVQDVPAPHTYGSRALYPFPRMYRAYVWAILKLLVAVNTSKQITQLEFWNGGVQLLSLPQARFSGNAFGKSTVFEVLDFQKIPWKNKVLSGFSGSKSSISIFFISFMLCLWVRITAGIGNLLESCDFFSNIGRKQTKTKKALHHNIF